MPHVLQQAQTSMHLLYKRSINADLLIELMHKFFDHTALSILTYGSEMFGFENLDIIENGHKDFLRKIK